MFINIYLVAAYVSDPRKPTPYDTGFFVFVAAVGVAYAGFICVLVKDDVKEFLRWVSVCGRNEADLSLQRRSDETQPLLRSSAKTAYR